MESLLSLMKCGCTFREFSDKPVSESDLLKVLEAGTLAPSGPVDGTHLIVVDDISKRRQIRAVCEQFEKKWIASQPSVIREKILALPTFVTSLDFLEKASRMIIVTTRPRDPEVPHAIETAFLAVGYMLVMIKALGLMTAPHLPSIHEDEDASRINQIMDLPDGECVQVLLPLGFPDKNSDSKPFLVRLNVYHNQFGKLFKPSGAR